MTTYTICVTDILPTVDGIQEAVRAIMPSTPIDFPGFNITLPTMPGLPSIGWPSMTSLNALLEMFANQLANNQLVLAISAAYDVVSSIFSLPFPPMPGLPFDFGDILSMNVDAMIDAIKSLYPNISLPSVPWPLYPTFNMPDMEILSTLQLAIGAYMYDMCNLLFTMVNEVADILKLPGMSAIPAFPSLSSILAMLPDVPSLDDLMNLSIPGFGSLLGMLPTPLIPGFDLPQYDFIQGLKMLYNEMATFSMKLITDFITGVLGLSLSIPLLCLPVSF